MKNTIIKELIGKTLIAINVTELKDELEFICSDGSMYRMYHDQDCCEHVSIEDIEGDLGDLLTSPILQAEESSNEDLFNGKPEEAESFTWTFYKFATIKGYVTIRWLGESNGYYSECVTFSQI